MMSFFESEDIPDSFWMTKWFLTMFLYNFPVKICARFWDYIIANDIFAMISLFVPIMDVLKNEFIGEDLDAC